MATTTFRRSIYRGVVLGGLLGDCYGSLYEDKATSKAVDILNFLTASAKGGQNMLCFTDDTQMSLAILRSLREKGKMMPSHLAGQFATDYFTDGAHRCYGGSISKVFNKLADSRYNAPFKPAAEQFNGTGSFGNGGGMRISAPVLYALQLTDKQFESFIIDVTSLTHTHPLAILGSLLQAYGIREVVRFSCHCASAGQANVIDRFERLPFVDKLLTLLSNVDMTAVGVAAQLWKEALKEYEARLHLVKELIQRSEPPSVSDVVDNLGNNLEAINSIPTALYVFLRSLHPIPDINCTSVLVRCMTYAYSLGGDTDTIGTMACALAGGLVGLPASVGGVGDVDPEELLYRCEGAELLDNYVDWLVSQVRKPSWLSHQKRPRKSCGTRGFMKHTKK